MIKMNVAKIDMFFSNNKYLRRFFVVSVIIKRRVLAKFIQYPPGDYLNKKSNKERFWFSCMVSNIARCPALSVSASARSERRSVRMVSHLRNIESIRAFKIWCALLNSGRVTIVSRSLMRVITIMPTIAINIQRAVLIIFFMVLIIHIWGFVVYIV